MDKTSKMAPRSARCDDSVGSVLDGDQEDIEEMQLLLLPALTEAATATQVMSTTAVSSALPAASPRKSSKKKNHRRKRRGSEVHSVEDGKYSTHSPSSSTVNDEICVPLTEKDSTPGEVTIDEVAPTDRADIPTVLVEPPSNTPSCAPSRDEEILEVLRDIVRNCTVQDPEKRASAAEVYATLEKLL